MRAKVNQVVSISSGLNGIDGTLVKEFRLKGDQYVKFLSDNEDMVGRLMNFKAIGNNILLKPKPEGFGMIRFCDVVFVVYPKSFVNNEKIDYDNLTYLFFWSGNKDVKIDLDVVQEISAKFKGNFFDFYFHLIFERLYKALRQYQKHIVVPEIIEGPGIRGRLKIVESVRKYHGLKHMHVVEVQTVTKRILFLGIVKGIIRQMEKLCAVKDARVFSKRALSLLSDIDEVALDKNSFAKLLGMRKILYMDSKKFKRTVDEVIELGRMLLDDVGLVTSCGFVFDMNTQFEKVFGHILENIAESSTIEVKSGNTTELCLLENISEGVTFVEDHPEKSKIKRAVNKVSIKPDYWVEKDGVPKVVFDTKYKILKITKDKEKIAVSGVRSKDVQQILTYWLHFFNINGKSPKLSLVYPVDGSIFKRSQNLIGQLGLVTFKVPYLDGVGLNEVSLEIWGMDLVQAVKWIRKKKGNLVDQDELVKFVGAA